MFEGYNRVKKLGQGAFGVVYLMEDEKGQQFALKEIDIRKLKKDDFLLQYLKGQISIMKQLKSEYVVRLYNVDKTENKLSLLCEYCDCGDLQREQARQPNKVFSLENAIKVLVDVIHGLEVIHSKGYLHRDIKSENILAKNENGVKKFKIADFGLSKKSEQGSTVLGTGHFMAPEIYLEERYSYGVDMWAFGVMFYVMLNKQFPFKENPHEKDLKKKYEFLCKQAQNFSYKSFVSEKTRLKKIDNCTEDVEQLFSRIFEIDPQKRMTFVEIRQHNLFAQHFPQIAPSSKILYSAKFTGKTLPEKPSLRKIDSIVEEEEYEQDMSSIRSTIKPKDKNYPEEKEFFERKNDEIDFLYDNYKDFSSINGVLKFIEILPLCYNLLKYYIILKRNFIKDINNGKFFKQNEGLKWEQFSNTKEFGKLFKEVQERLGSAEDSFFTIHLQCEEYLDQINQKNPKFKEFFNPEIKQTEFDDFKNCYRKSTLYVFQKLKSLLKDQAKGNKIHYLLTIAVISHVFNHIFKQKEKMEEIFAQFFNDSRTNSKNINYETLREWLTTATTARLTTVTKNIIQKYFT